jgi:competence protein ComEC
VNALATKLRAFWDDHPALLIGFFVYVGAHMALCPHVSFLIPCLFFLFCPSKEVLFGALVGVLVYVWVAFSVQFPPEPLEELEGRAKVAIENISQEIRYGEVCWKTDMTLLEFSSKSGYAKNIPCRAWLKDMPDANFLLEQDGILKKCDDRRYAFRPVKGAEWKRVSPHFSLVTWRFEAKNAFRCFLRRHLPPGDERTFLEGLIMGEFHDPILADSLRHFGLSHMMVVAGFHFSMITLFLGFLVRLIFPGKAATCALLMAINGYFFFLGPCPSVVRAWISMCVILLGKLFERKATGLNCLGLGLIALILYEPAMTLHLGFQLSFLATFAILLFYPLFESGLSAIFPPRRVSTLVHMNMFDQFCWIILSFIKKSVALVAAVSVLMFPMCLYVFGKTPFSGIVYNAFFPFFTSICMMLLGVALLFSWLPLVNSILFYLVHICTSITLTYVSAAPLWFGRMYRSDIPEPFFALFLSSASALGVILYAHKRASQDFVTIDCV